MTTEGILNPRGDAGKPIAEGKQIRIDAGEKLGEEPVEPKSEGEDRGNETKGE